MLGYMAKRIKAVGGTRVANQLISRQGDDRGPSLIAQAPKMRDPFRAVFRERAGTAETGSERVSVAGLAERGRPSLEAGKGKETGSLVQPPEGMQSADPLTSAQGNQGRLLSPRTARGQAGVVLRPEVCGDVLGWQ